MDGNGDSIRERKDRPRTMDENPPPTVEREYTPPQQLSCQAASPPRHRTRGADRDGKKRRKMDRESGVARRGEPRRISSGGGGGGQTRVAVDDPNDPFPGTNTSDPMQCNPSWMKTNHTQNTVRPSETERHARIQRRGTSCHCNEMSSVPTHASDVDSTPIGTPCGCQNSARVVVRHRNVQVETNTRPTKPKNDAKRKTRSYASIPARENAPNETQSQTSKNKALQVLVQ